jgi:hypothetical protein
MSEKITAFDSQKEEIMSKAISSAIKIQEGGTLDFSGLVSDATSGDSFKESFFKSFCALLSKIIKLFLCGSSVHRSHNFVVITRISRLLAFIRKFNNMEIWTNSTH